MDDAPKDRYILVFEKTRGWVKAKWVPHAGMFSIEDPEYRSRFFPVKEALAWQELPECIVG